MIVKLLTEHHLEFLSLTGGCTGVSESTLVKTPHCWKSHVTAHVFLVLFTWYHCFLKQRTVAPNRLMWYLFLTPLAVKEGPTFRNNWIS